MQRGILFQSLLSTSPEFQHSPLLDNHFFLSSSDMITQDLEWHEVMELILRLYEAELRKEEEKTREMEEQLRADIAALDAKENERLMLLNERDKMLAVTKAVDKLVTEFLHADDDNFFDAQGAMKNEIVALLRDQNGEIIGELDNAQN